MKETLKPCMNTRVSVLRVRAIASCRAFMNMPPPVLAMSVSPFTSG